MDAKRQSHWWWFDSHNSPRCSPWLQSTLAELDEKTKTMLKLIEQDADSFAQRAEMYYKKRPELISMVEDFYRTHRSLAERYDQLRVDPSVRAKSPLRHSFSHFPKGLFENALESVKSLDSFSDEAYNSEESAESEIDDPEQEYYVVDQDGNEGEKQFLGGVSYGELMKLREELEQLQEENEIQRNQIFLKDEENEKLVAQLRSLREEIHKIKGENDVILKKQTNDMKKLKDEMESLKVQNMSLREEIHEIKRENDIILQKQTNDMKKLKDEMESLKIQNMNHKSEVMKLRQESEMEQGCLKDALMAKDEEKREVIRQLSLAMEMLREENRVLKKSSITDGPKKCSSPEFQIFKGMMGLGKLFSFSPKCQASIVPL